MITISSISPIFAIVDVAVSKRREILAFLNIEGALVTLTTLIG